MKFINATIQPVLFIALVFLGIQASAQTLLSEDFESYSGQISDYNAGSPSYVSQTHTRRTSEGDQYGAWDVSSSSIYDDNCSSCNSKYASIATGQDQTGAENLLYLGTITPSSSNLNISFNYSFDDKTFGDEYQDYLSFILRPTAGGSDITVTQIGNTVSNDVSGSTTNGTFTGNNIAVTSGTEYQAIIIYSNTDITFNYSAYGAAVDDIKIDMVCPTFSFAKTCNPDLSYDLAPTVNSMAEATSATIVNTANTFSETGITGTGLRPSFTGVTGYHTFKIYDESNQACSTEVSTTPCSICDELTISFGDKNCQSDLGLNTTISVIASANVSASGGYFYINDGTNNYHENSNSTNDYEITSDGPITTIYVRDQTGATCKDTTYSECQPCDNPLRPADEPCRAPILDAEKPFVGSTSCTEYDKTTNSPSGCGSMSIDSWFEFKAASTDVEIEYEVWDDPDPTYNCTDGVQLAMFSVDTNALTCLGSDTSLSSISPEITMVSGSCVNVGLGVTNVGGKRKWEFSGISPGNKYLIRIDGYASQKCRYSFEPKKGIAISHPNDSINQAKELSCGTRDTADILLATAGDAPSGCGGTNTEKGMWYKFTGQGGAATITTDFDTTDFNTKIRIFKSNAAHVDSLVCENIFNDDISGANNKSSVTFVAENNQDYYIYVSGSTNADVGVFTIGLNCCGLALSVDNDKNDTICSGDSVRYAVTSGATNYKFYANNVLQQNSADSIYMHRNGSNNDVITVAVLVGSCTDSLIADTLVVNNQPNATLATVPATTTLCAGDSIVFNASPSSMATYNFLKDNSSVQSSNVDSLKEMYITTGGAYRVVITDVGGCFDTSSVVNITVNSKPTVSLSSSDGDDIICAGDSLSFTATPNTLANYNFLLNGISTQSSADSIYENNAIANGATVNVIATDANGCLDTATLITTTVNTKPSITFAIDDADTTICEGDAPTFTVSPAGIDNYNFFINNVSDQSSNSNTYSITSLANLDSVYAIATTTDGCSDTTDLIGMTVNDRPNASLVADDLDSTICDGDTVTFTASPGGLTTYDFYLNTASDVASGSNTYESSTLSNNDSIMVIVTDANNCVDSSTYIPFTVNTLPSIGLSNNSTNDSICSGQSVVFTATGAATYDFQVNTASQQNSAIDTFDITSLANNAIVFAIGTDANGCIDTSHSDTFTVTTVNNVLLTNTATNNTICSGGTITFNATGATNYEFFLNDTSILNSAVNNFSTDSLENDEYVYVVGSINGCTDTSNADTVIVSNDIVASLTNDGDANLVCQGATITFTASGGDNFVFKLNEDTIQDGASNIYVTDSLVDGDDIEVIVTSGVGGVCIDSTINDMTVSPNPTASMTDNNLSNTICDQDTVIYTASGGTNYNFILNDTASLQNSASPTFEAVNLNSGDKIYVIVANTSNCLDTSATDTVTVNDLPNLVFGVDDSILCVDQEVTFTTSGGTNYHYFLNDSSVQNSANANFSPDSAIQNDSVFVVVTDANNCSDTSRIISLDVNANPEVDLVSDLAGDSVCNGNTITITDTFNQGNNYNFAIGALSQQDGASNAFSSDELSDGDQINVTVTNANNCSTEDSIIVTVITTTGNLVSSDADNIICAGDTVIYTASGGSSYVFFNNTDSIAATANIQIIPEDGDVISVIVTDQGCNDTVALDAILANNSPAIQFDVDDSTICPGTDINLTAGGGSNYEFVMNGVTLQDSSLTNLTIENAVQDDSIFVIVSTGNNCIDTSYILTIDTNAIPNVELVSNVSGDSSCFGDVVTFYDSIADATSFQFTVNGTVLPETADSFVSTSNFDNGDLIEVTVTSTEGCINEDSLRMTVSTIKASLNLSDPDNSICIGDQVTYSASGGAEYSFYVNNVLTSVADEMTITPNFGDVISVNVTQFGCSDSTFLQPIIVNDYDQADFTFDNPSYCASGSTLPILNDNSMSGTWSANSNDLALQPNTGELFLSNSLIGDYLVTFITNGPCPDTHVEAVTVQPALTQPVTESDFTICNDNSVEVSGNEIIVGSLNWTVEEGNYSAIVNSDSSTATIVGITPGEILTIYYEVTSPVCQDLRDTLIITHDSIPQVVFAGQDILCYADTIALDASNPSIARSGTWSSSDANNVFSDINGPNSYITNLSENGTTTLVWTVEDTFCSHFGTDTLLLTNQYSTATIAPEKDSAIILSPTTFALQETDLTSFEWFINGESMGSDNPLVHTFIRPETHSIMIAGMDNNGCPFTRTIPYNAFTVQDIFVGEFFTPNGDGKNDIIAPMGYLVDAQNYKFNVYDRWGNLVFEANQAHQYWDGNNIKTGKPCVNDGYSWFLSYIDENGQEILLKGMITLFR